MTDNKTLKPLDVGALWDALAPVSQRRIGIAALVFELVCEATYRTPDAAARSALDGTYDIWARLDILADRVITQEFDNAVLEQAPERYLPPRFTVFGLAEGVCRKCGCTDDDACEGGCSWIEPDLCSACVEKPE